MNFFIFSPTPPLIKKRIEALIERDYLTRDNTDRNLYKYVAWGTKEADFGKKLFTYWFHPFNAHLLSLTHKSIPTRFPVSRDLFFVSCSDMLVYNNISLNFV